MTCRRLSSSPFAVGLTTLSDICRSTSTVALAWYRSGRYTAKEAAETTSVVKTTNASHRRRHVLGQSGRELLTQIDGRQPRRLNVVDERQRHFAVGPDRDRSTEVRILPDLDIENVLGSDEKVAGAWIARGRIARVGRVLL